MGRTPVCFNDYCAFHHKGYCLNDFGVCEYRMKKKQIACEICNPEQYPVFHVSRKYDGDMTIRANFCPVCGRDLRTVEDLT